MKVNQLVIRRESQEGIKVEHLSNVMLLRRYDRPEGNTLEI